MTVWYAPAKLNLFLHVVGKYDDGYHKLQTIFQLIDWCDELEFNINSTGRISRYPEIEGIKESEDLTVRAALALRRRYPGYEGVRIHLRKSIPIGAGLGGGSSDAACTLVVLNQLWNLNLNIVELMQIGMNLGADIPAMMLGVNAWGEGKGHLLSPISLPAQLYFVLIPPVLVATKRVYEACNFENFREEISRIDYFTSNTGNDLTKAVCANYPEVEAALAWLSKHGEARITGSGGAMFIKLRSQRQGESLLEELPEDYQARICWGLAS